MKILRIRFENINSLKGLHEIDFRNKPLVSSGLFAITGPTGSGKSTILDVITLALFNRIPRISEKISKTVIDKTGLILTRNMEGCFAEVTYESGAGVFTSKWSIERARTGNLKDYEMSLARKDNTLFPLRKAEVSEKNEELIGLNFDQFVKAIILAQGDFAAFLKAKGGEREKLLEQVTGSWIYREIGKAAFNKNKEVGQELERLTIEEKQHRSRMLDELAYKALEDSLIVCDGEISSLNGSVTKLNAEKKLKEEIQTLGITINQREQSESEILIEQKNFLDLNGTRLEKHRKLIPHQKKIWEWEMLKKQIDENTTGLELKKQEISDCSARNTALVAEVINLTGSDDEIPKALSDFETKVISIENEKAEKDTRLKGKKENVLETINELSLNIDLTDYTAAGKLVESAFAENRSVISSLTARLGKKFSAKPDEELTKLKTLSAEAHAYKTSKTLLDDKLRYQTEEIEAAEKIGQEIADLPDIIVKTRESGKTGSLILENLEKDAKIRDLTSSLEDQRKKLREGEPCPLCGSSDHPYSEKVPHFSDDLDDSIRKAKSENENYKRAVITFENRLVIKEMELKKKKIKIEEIKNESDSLLMTCDSILEKIHKEYRTLAPQEIINKIETGIKDLESLISATAKKNKLEDLKTETMELVRMAKESSELAVKRDEIFKGRNIRAVTSGYLEKHSSIITLSAKLQQEDKAIANKLTSDKKDLKDGGKILLKVLMDYKTIEAAIEDIIAEDEYSKLDNADQKYSRELLTIMTELSVNKLNLKELKAKDTDREGGKIDEELDILRISLLEKNTFRDSMVSKKSIHDDAAKSLERIAAEILSQRTKNEKWMLLDKYIGDAEGKRFSVFAQQLTLFQLVKLANKRLMVLSDRYQLDVPEEGEDDSLSVIDMHMGDLRRSVKSLSGGESFLVSLSLALALSDLASRQVEIKSLFIDEGFGALDKLTLDQTIDTLERLQNETNKTIGIISHIEAMQERITTQIRLSKNGQGYSTVEIVS